MAKIIEGNRNEQRANSRVLDEEIREAIREGSTEIHVVANGQHGIGGRLWGFPEPVTITVEGPVGQRLGGMGMFGTRIIAKGSVSDDVGWLNCGAEITVLGDAGNGAHNAAAQGKLYVRGSGGARCDTMTKHNPKYDPPQSWYFRDVGDTFAEFKAGGIAVICGVEPRNRNNIIGYRPCVGMVGGIIYFRGPIETYSEPDVRLLELTPQDWQWLKTNMRPFLRAIEREDHYRELTKDAGAWRKLIPLTAREREKTRPFAVSLGEFRKGMWEAGVGGGGIFAEYIDHPGTVLPYITTGQDRRFRPSWNNGKYAPPCEYTCPSGIPTWQRTRLIREGKLNEALELVLRYSPLPASVSLRPMSINDLEEVQKLDEIAFDPLWRISLSALRNAFQQSAYATVAQSGGKIIGYQLSTSTPYSAHLARLAVHPQQQRQNIGHALVQDFLQFTRANDLWRVTVNTQSDNDASLALYAPVGFGTTNENFPVFTLNWK